MATAKPAKPCALTQAAFSDVPYILDSIWRRMEFEAYRVGRINLIKPHRFTKEHAVPWPFFAAYLVISSFIVFGPTFTTVCNSFGWWGAVTFRLALGLQAKEIRVSNPLVPRLGNRFEQWWHQITRRTSYVYLKQGEVDALWAALFGPKANFCTPRDSDSKHMRRVSEWICGRSDAWDIKLDTADPQIDAWRQLVSDLGDTGDPGVSGSPGSR
jgi:hypothetical protein